MEKITFREMCNKFEQYNKEHNIHRQFEGEPMKGVIVYKASNWPKEYSLESRSYEVCSNEKYFLPEMSGRSLFSHNLDGTDPDVRLDQYRWDVEYCYILP